ncbi:hypothetical protein BJ138DRAFT_1142982 [Hygrophoropsis aurantiaca]|uniref:Uncharacterized protein n=1 Tax=Hygrophoropsis aurantiaca TaxID=72124 RepID=A0ACB8AN88_9AGAM|nr:hypothetical protein BJ138DRAFT_1142982 [Hygrophoropsis aurantiaca]
MIIRRHSCTSPSTQHELWLSGSVSYAIIQYLDVLDIKQWYFDLTLSRVHTSDLAQGCLFLVEAKRLSDPFHPYLVEAVAQDIALLTKQTKYIEHL